MEAMEERVETFCGVEKAGGAGIHLATCSAGSAHGTWRLSHSRAMNVAFRTASFNERGLSSDDPLTEPNRRVRTRTHGGMTGKVP